MAKDFDVVVVGGGPAGSSAAYYLARSGANILLMEKARTPREKVCGECMTPRALRVVTDMGLDAALKDEFFRVRGFRIAYRERAPVEFEVPKVPTLPDCMYTARRPKLDGMLLGCALEAGSGVWEECRVTGPLLEGGRVAGVRAIREGRPVEVTAGVVIGADGVNSILGKSLGLMINDERNMVIAVRQLFEGVTGMDDCLEFYYMDEVMPGYAWLFPMSSTLANVGVGTYVSTIRREKIDLHGLLRTFVNNTSVAPRFKGARPASPPRGSLIRMGLKCSRVEFPGLILVGDAASIVNPANGEGISYALESGRMAAEYIIETAGSAGPTHNPEINPFIKRLETRYGGYFSVIGWIARHGLSSPAFWSAHDILARTRPYRRYFMVAFSNLRRG